MRNFSISRRRRFVGAALTAAAGIGLAACSTAPEVPPTPTPMPGMDTGASAAQPTIDVEAMDTAHESVVKAFLAGIEANSKTFWPARLPFKMDGDTKVFELTTQAVTWETRPGDKVQAYAYNGVVPGPEIRVTEGDKVRVILKNQLPESTSIHWHGLHTPNAMDGVPFITQPVVKPGASFTYEFVAKPSRHRPLTSAARLGRARRPIAMASVTAPTSI